MFKKLHWRPPSSDVDLKIHTSNDRPLVSILSHESIENSTWLAIMRLSLYSFKAPVRS